VVALAGGSQPNTQNPAAKESTPTPDLRGFLIKAHKGAKKGKFSASFRAGATAMP